MRVLSLAATLACALLARPAAGEPRAVRLARALAAQPGPRPPLTDGRARFPVLFALPPGSDARALGLLPVGGSVATAWMDARTLTAFSAAHPSLRPSLSPPLHARLDQATKLTGAAAYRARTGRDGTGVVVGVVDTGIDVTHPDFLDEAGRSRVAWLLDLSYAPAHLHDDLEHRFGCDDPAQAPCAVFAATDLDALRAGGALPVPTDAVGHGSHVASIAAGDGADGSGPGRYAGIAPGADLVVVRATPDASELLTDVDIARGADFVFHVADEVLHEPAVLNLSLGGDYGPHDGTSPLEKALASHVGGAGHAITVAAGNSGMLFDDGSGIHTETRVAAGERVRVPLASPRSLGHPPVNGSAFVWLTFGAGERVSVGLDGWDGARLVEQVGPGGTGGYTAPDGTFGASIVNDAPSADGTGLTDDTTGAIVSWAGTWPAGTDLTLTLEGEGTAELWVQGEGDAATSVFGAGQRFRLARKEGTINVPATSPALLAVGCTLDRTSWTDRHGDTYAVGAFGAVRAAPVETGCYFSAAGPTATGVAKPELSAPGAFVAAAMSSTASPDVTASGTFLAPDGVCEGGRRDCLLVDDRHALLSGTSMSAPAVAGAVALLFQRDPGLTADGVRALLQAGAHVPTGFVAYDFQLGVGALDIEGAMAALAAKGNPLVGVVPDPARSWLALSAPTLRPDPGWSIEGTVELRAADGSIADGFDASRLALVVTGASVARPLARVAPGLYRFAVAGDARTGGGTAHVEVDWDGVAIGTGARAYAGSRSVPIGADAWLAKNGVSASGGCAVGPRPGAPRLAAWLALIAVGALARAVTRRRA